MYRYIVLLHVLSGFFFMMSHGASAAVAFRLRYERDFNRIRALLELTSSTMRAMYGTLLLILITGITAGVLGRWWLQGWFWISVVLLVGITVYMGFRGSRVYYPLKAALGLPNPWSKEEARQYEVDKQEGVEKPVDGEEVERLLAANRPWEMALVSLIGWAVILWLMMLKPF
jgi:hypothetical protein